MFRTFDFTCQSCGKKEARLVEVSEKPEMQTETCSCGSAMSRVFSIPNVRTAKLSTTFIDGQRSRTKEFQQLRRQDALENVVSDQWLSKEDRQEASKELQAIVGGEK